MNEDLAAMVRTGVTIVLVAALTSTVLTLMVVAQTILDSGSGTLANNVDAISLQKYQTFNGGKKKSGTDVRSAVGQYANEDCAIIIHTKSMPANTYYNFNTLLKGAPIPTEITVNGSKCLVSKITDISTVAKVESGQPYRLGELAITNGLPDFNGDTKILESKGHECYILDSARFSPQLIKDNSGLIIGIMFTQV